LKNKKVDFFGTQCRSPQSGTHCLTICIV